MTPLEKDPRVGWNAAVAAQIRAERAAAPDGMTVDQLATKSEIPRRTLLRLLNAQRAIDVSHAAALAEALGLTLEELFGRAQQRLGDHTWTLVVVPPADSDELSEDVPNLGAVANDGEIEGAGEQSI